MRIMLGLFFSISRIVLVRALFFLTFYEYMQRNLIFIIYYCPKISKLS